MKLLSSALAGLVVLGAVGAGAGYGALRASLPDLVGERPLAGLGAAVTVERDSLGVVQITGETKADVLRALGFVHAQERFFGMDLLRRASAGELSALLGADLVETDRALRPHRLRARAAEAVAALAPERRALLGAYVEGVNAGLAALSARPFEYAALRQTPAPWREEDTFLVAFAMFLDLQRAGFEDELEARAERAALPAAVRRFLRPGGDEWDAPLTGDAVDAPGVPPLDSLGGFRVGALDPAAEAADTYAALAGAEAVGSNNFAVAGSRTVSGAALVADDMHLGLRLPHLWFRASLTAAGRRVAGVTLAGVPAVIVGTTADVAWGFTNSYGDFADLVALVPTGRAGGVRTAAGDVPLDTLRETIEVAGGEAVALDVVQSPFGPVLFEDEAGTRYALQWAAHRPGAVNLELLDLWDARTLGDAVAVAHRAGIPAQNFVAGDRAGRVGWTIAGRLPARAGRDGQTPVPSTDADARWSGWLDAADVPRLLDPADGLLWTANARVTSGANLARIGLGPYTHGARQRQIRDALRAHAGPFTEADLHALQLDDRALFLARWHTLLLGVLDADALAERPERAALRERVAAWGGRASADSPGYGAVRRFRDAFAGQLTPALLAPVRELYPAADDVAESALWALATEQPAHLLPSGAASWRAVLLESADAALGLPATWGDQNRVAIAHPMAAVLPGPLGAALRLPDTPQPGDGRMPRVARPEFGASQRMVVAPGFEDRGILTMPGGQAGHPLSPYWAAGHDAWVEGRALPLLPGPARWTLRLVPG